MRAVTDPVVRALGDAALLFEFGEVIDAGVNARVLAAWRAILALRLPGVLDVVPAYASLAVHFDPARVEPGSLASLVCDACRSPVEQDETRPVVSVPVCYEAAFAPDMDEVCAHTGLSMEEVVARHTAVVYRVFFLGFTPGFPYLGGLDPRLAVPRRDTPRTRIEPGSVAIGGAQTGVYPGASPGGWHIIGRTPIRLFDHGRTPACLLAPGDRLRFVPVSADGFSRLHDGD
jgi:KipI family sensor histidine kinase inhibitor